MRLLRGRCVLAGGSGREQGLRRGVCSSEAALQTKAAAAGSSAVPRVQLLSWS